MHQAVVTKMSPWRGFVCESALVNEHACAPGRVRVAVTLRQSCVRSAFQDLLLCVYFSLVQTGMALF